MEIFHNYNKQEINWQKSVNEISKFIIDHLDSINFYDFINDEMMDKEKKERWSVRLEELKDKATKRLGYKIDQNKLLKEAFFNILNQKNKGELVISNSLEYFCSNIDDLVSKIK